MSAAVALQMALLEIELPDDGYTWPFGHRNRTVEFMQSGCSIRSAVVLWIAEVRILVEEESSKRGGGNVARIDGKSSPFNKNRLREIIESGVLPVSRAHALMMEERRAYAEHSAMARDGAKEPCK